MSLDVNTPIVQSSIFVIRTASARSSDIWLSTLCCALDSDMNAMQSSVAQTNSVAVRIILNLIDVCVSVAIRSSAKVIVREHGWWKDHPCLSTTMRCQTTSRTYSGSIIRVNVSEYVPGSALLKSAASTLTAKVAFVPPPQLVLA